MDSGLSGPPMRVVVAGLGVQGHKRRRDRRRRLCRGRRSRSTRTPTTGRSRTFRSRTMTRSLACIPDEPKIEILNYCSATASTCWSRSRCGRSTTATSPRLRRSRAGNGVVCYTAYNHRFEPHFVRMRDLIAVGRARRDLFLPHVLRQRHGAAGARFGVARSGRRRAARSRLASARHLPFLVRRHRGQVPVRRRARLREPRAGPCRHRIARTSLPRIELEMTLLMWRNHFTCDILAENGSAHIQSLCKWGPSRSPSARACCRADARRRRPIRSCRTIRPGRSNTRTSRACAARARTTDLSNDIWLHRVLQRLGAEAVAPSRCAMKHAGRRFRRHDPPRARLGVGRGRAAASRSCASMPTAALIRRLARQDWPVLEPGLDELIRSNARRQRFTATRGRPAAVRCRLRRARRADRRPGSQRRRRDRRLDRDVAGDEARCRHGCALAGAAGLHARARRPAPQRLYYQVETLVFGRAVERATKPERYIVGCADPAAPLDRTLSRRARCIRLPDPADALRERGAGQNLHQLLPRGLGQRRQYAWPSCASRSAPTGRRSRRR